MKTIHAASTVVGLVIMLAALVTAVVIGFEGNTYLRHAPITAETITARLGVLLLMVPIFGGAALARRSFAKIG
jgi:hypothetical protein